MSLLCNVEMSPFVTGADMSKEIIGLSVEELDPVSVIGAVAEISGRPFNHIGGRGGSPWRAGRGTRRSYACARTSAPIWESLLG